MRKIDLTGKVFGRLTAVCFAYRKGGRRFWLCKCQCGNTTYISVTNINSVRPVQSCGCLRLEVLTKGRESNWTHREAGLRTTEYRAWENMQARCYNPNHPNYRYYGPMGVTVCKRWRDSFEVFLSDMGRKPSVRHSLDRYPDPYGNYKPSNCRWATPIQQRHNRRDSIKTKGDNHV